MHESLKELAFVDLDREFTVTRRVLEGLPEDRFGWKLHEKSPTLGKLAMHVATLPQWMADTLEKDELDLLTAKGPPSDAKDRAELLATFDGLCARVKSAMERV